ncbi:hypothetical protein JCM6882_003578 [Rhodosporidiobolus microsporus]
MAAESTPAYFSLLAGATAGCVESFVTFPTEFVKTTAQLSAHSSSSFTGGGAAVAPGAIVRQTWQQRGLAGFYAGAGPFVVGNALKAGVRFLTYDAVRDALRDSEGKITPSRTLLAGICAGALESSLAVTPSEAIKTRLIESRRAGGPPLGAAATVRQLVQQEGVSSLWRGLAPTMMKQCANSAVRFSSYQALKDLALAGKPAGGKELGTLEIMGIGSAAGVITVYSTMPFDVVKTRMQQSLPSSASPSSSATATASATRSPSALRTFTDILTREGPATFWRGSSPRVLRLVVSGSVTWVVYENVMRGLRGL